MEPRAAPVRFAPVYVDDVSPLRLLRGISQELFLAEDGMVNVFRLTHSRRLPLKEGPGSYPWGNTDESVENSEVPGV